MPLRVISPPRALTRPPARIVIWPLDVTAASALSVPLMLVLDSIVSGARLVALATPFGVDCEGRQDLRHNERRLCPRTHRDPQPPGIAAARFEARDTAVHVELRTFLPALHGHMKRI